MNNGYGYAVARLRAMERRFLEPATLVRLVDAEDYGQTLKILTETHYGTLLSGETSPAALERILEEELLGLCAEMRGFVPDDSLLALVRVPYDYHNVKTLLKSALLVKRGGRKRWDLLTSLGSIPVDELITAIESEDCRLLPFGLDAAVTAALGAYEQSGDLLEMERILDAAQFSAMGRIAGRIGSPGIGRYLRFRIDGENLRTLLRLKRFGMEPPKVTPYLHPGGTVALSLFASLAGEPLEGWPRSLSFSDLAPVLGIFGEGRSVEDLLSSVETSLEEEGLRLLEEYRTQLEAPENVLWHLLAKETEIRNLRVILVSKANGTDKSTTRRLLRRGTPG
jgi:V/A-type H+-transporting ATPase subunit C